MTDLRIPDHLEMFSTTGPAHSPDGLSNMAWAINNRPAGCAIDQNPRSIVCGFSCLH